MVYLIKTFNFYYFICSAVFNGFTKKNCHRKKWRINSKYVHLYIMYVTAYYIFSYTHIHTHTLTLAYKRCRAEYENCIPQLSASPNNANFCDWHKRYKKGITWGLKKGVVGSGYKQCGGMHCIGLWWQSM